MHDLSANDLGQSWRLHGASRQVAVFVAASFLTGALLAIAIDVLAAESWDAAALQAWTLLPQIASGAGLFYMGRRDAHRSFIIMAALIALIVIEEAFHVLNPLTSFLEETAGSLPGWGDGRVTLLHNLAIYSLIAAVGAAFILLAFRSAQVEEKPVIRNLTLLLIAGGVFGGPLSIASVFGGTRRWLYLEELGEAVVFAVIAGYVVGLMARSRSHRRR